MTKLYSYLITAFISVAIILSVILGISLFFPFAASILFSMAVLSLRGLKVKDLFGMAWAGIFDCRVLFLFILLIGANISVWMASGIVPALMYYGFEYLNGENLLVIAFLITGGISVFMGTAVGTIGTLGIALLGIGRGFGIHPGILLGALVSGAFLADKISPISGLLNLTMKVTGTSYAQVIRAMVKTLIPVLVLTSAGYYLLGSTLTLGENGFLVQQYRDAIMSGFNISPFMLLLPLGIVVLPLTGMKTLPTVFAGLAGGTVLALTYQGVSLSAILNFVLWGYKSSGESAELNSILFSGGVWGMTEVVLIVAAIISLSSILEKAGVLKPLIYDPIAGVKAPGELILKTGIAGIFMTMLTCDQTAGIVLQGRFYTQKYRELGMDGAILARTISDTGTIVAPLIPWNINAIIVGLSTGITAAEYVPYAFMCYLFPLTVVAIYFIKKRSQQTVEHVLND